MSWIRYQRLGAELPPGCTVPVPEQGEHTRARDVGDGRRRDDLDAHFAASSLFALTAVAALDWLALEPERSLEDVATQIERLTAIAAI